MSQTDPRAMAKELAQEICSGLGVYNLSDAGMAIMVQHIDNALADAERVGLERAAGLVPTNWCDPLLTGPNGIDATTRGIDCRVIEQLLRGIQDRIRAQAHREGGGGCDYDSCNKWIDKSVRNHRAND